jgi:8-oxo-dGTP pyrophosphatase MutT (NUDIX family)
MFEEYLERKFLLKTLDEYKKITLFANQNHTVQQFSDFIKNEPNCFKRNNHQGHVTGSALVTNSTFTKVLFTYHAKLQKWLQLGGHADGEHLIHDVAKREAIEESGISEFEYLDIQNFPFSSAHYEDKILPFDIDIHLIPENKYEPAHQHYDVRYLLKTDSEDFQISEESLDLKWIDINEVSFYTNDPSTLRQIEKLKFLTK